MPYVIVERVSDPEAAADDLTRQGKDKRAAEVRERGKGTFVVPDALPAWADREYGERELTRRRGVSEPYGMHYHLRLDYDPDWSKQNAAIEAALREVPALRHRSAVAASNAFVRSYYGYGPRWDIPQRDGTGWPQVDAINFRDHAYVMTNALAGLHLIDAERVRLDALHVAARVGWDLTEPRDCADLTTENWLAFSLGRTLRQCGEGNLDRLREVILHAEYGNA